MKFLLLLIFSFFSFDTVFAQNCSNLKNGIYDIEYDSLFREYPKARFEIAGDTCYVTTNGVRKYYEMVIFYKCTFSLRDTAKIDKTKLTEFQKQSLSRKPFYEIYKVDGNSYFFIYKVDAHIQINSGRFVKIDK